MRLMGIEKRLDLNGSLVHLLKLVCDGRWKVQLYKYASYTAVSVLPYKLVRLGPAVRAYFWCSQVYTSYFYLESIQVAVVINWNFALPTDKYEVG